jgi:hypothetical protein
MELNNIPNVHDYREKTFATKESPEKSHHKDKDKSLPRDATNTSGKSAQYPIGATV